MLRIQVRSRIDHSAETALGAAFAKLGTHTDVKLSRVFWLTEREPGAIAAIADIENVLHDPISEDVAFGTPAVDAACTYVEIRHRAGVTDNLARTATEALMIVAGAPTGSSWQDWTIHVASGWQLELQGRVSEAAITEVLYRDLANPLLHEVAVSSGAALAQQPDAWFRAAVDASAAFAAPPQDLTLFPLDMTTLDRVNQERGLALSASELGTIIRQFSAPSDFRSAQGWAGHITEVELECIAQSWSEHCKHKIFSADIDYTEVDGEFPALGARRIQGLYQTCIQQPTHELTGCGYLVSVFSDNAGIVDFDPQVNLCIKVETHNSPSALDPYGGAITGILGVNRDIIGCGLGAKPIANLDVFCLSTAELFPPPESPERPTLLKDPAVIFRGVHKGVEDGGNQSGIPTIEGGLRFASEYGGKPLVFVGSVGVMPKKVGERASHEKKILPGDRIVVAGGRLGKDGVHGATFSSLALQDGVAANVVQIGDPITQKRVLDFTLAARDRGWIRAITDNGAGGLSSSIGEMAQLSGGARLDLSRHAVKYAGLAFWEMLVSESQERMSYAVAPEHLDVFMQLARDMSVEAWDLGEFTATGVFEVHYAGRELARIDLDFLHHGLGKMQLKARWAGPQKTRPFYRRVPRQAVQPGLQALPQVLLALLAAPNVASREFMVRRYDHEVQAATRLKPFTGRTQSTPNDAGVIDLHVHGGREDNALVLAHGLCPQFSAFDTYLMAQKAVDAALRNLVAAGGDPARAALVDNFCWPDPLEGPGNPDAQHKLGQLVRACEGMAAAARAFKAPFVSGKDSMKNDFVGTTQGGQRIKISVPPTLLVTAIAPNPNAEQTVSAEFKNAGDVIYVLGDWTESLCGSTYADVFEAETHAPEYPDLARNAARYRTLHALMQQGLVASCHTVQEGGVLATAIECCFGNRIGMDLSLDGLRWPQWFSETGSLFVVSVHAEHRAAFESAWNGTARELGRTTPAFKLRAHQAGDTVELDLHDAFEVWSHGVRRFYDA
ncbi:MAG: phosphoribosylformylglycinamidine synthase [Burkholderiaceae bacterium]|nr:MAG: phosphoribosylformylglycinamidine synthase [Burkholderiaceae bacterium]